MNTSNFKLYFSISPQSNMSKSFGAKGQQVLIFMYLLWIVVIINYFHLLRGSCRTVIYMFGTSVLFCRRLLLSYEHYWSLLKSIVALVIILIELFYMLQNHWVTRWAEMYPSGTLTASQTYMPQALNHQFRGSDKKVIRCCNIREFLVLFTYLRSQVSAGVTRREIVL